MVILWFLRNVWATIIPAITVAAIAGGTFAVLTSSATAWTTFADGALDLGRIRRDDAVVVIETSYASGGGGHPLEAALQGAGESVSPSSRSSLC